MRACIIGIQNIKHMTLISIYTHFFEQHGIEYDLIYIDKYGIAEKNHAKNVYKLNVSLPFFSTPIGKAIKGIAFKAYAENILRKKYDFVVVWREQTASMFASFLAKYYAGRYCINIRDLWDMRNEYITRGVGKAVKFSAFNTISSEGFREALPSGDYIMMHSVNPEILSDSYRREMRNKNEQITISYVGTVRFVPYCCSLVDAFAKDSRFLLKFIGQGSDEIQRYVESKKITNVQCIGQFSPKDTLKYLDDTDIINSAFGASELAEKQLMPIRYYYALYLNCPVLTTSGTWVDKEAHHVGIGISVPSDLSMSEGVSEQVYQDYQRLIRSNIHKELDEYREKVKQSNLIVTDLLESVFGIAN